MPPELTAFGPAPRWLTGLITLAPMLLATLT